VFDSFYLPLVIVSNTTGIHILRLTAFCIRMYREWAKLGCLKLLCNLFGLIPVADNTDDITQASFSCHILISSYFKCVDFWSFFVMVM